MKIGILQPGYLPWLGFFEQMYKSDVFIIYDDVQYDKDGWRNRNRIKTPKGVQWLTVPVHVKFQDKPLINEVKIDNRSNWRKKQLASLKINYAKAPFFRQHIDIFEEAYSREWEQLIDLDLHLIVKLAESLGIDSNKKIRRSSELKPQGDRNGRLVSLCKMFKADIFYEGASGKNYIEESMFEKEEIKVIFQDYKHPVYSQLYGEFVPYLSVVDLLFNCGPDSLKILMS